MKKINDQELLKISELAKAAGVSTSTIHYYTQEGLITPPTKTSRNMAYYDPRCVQEIHQIQELQSQKYLPLSAIKLLMKAKQGGQAPGHLVEMRSFMENIFRPILNQNAPRALSQVELISGSGLSESDLNDLEKMGLIGPQNNESGASYDDIDLSIAQIFKKMSAAGIQTSDLEVFHQYIEVARAEAQAMHTMMHRLPDHNNIPINDILKMVTDLKGYLSHKIYRQEAIRLLEHSRPKGENGIELPYSPTN
jgi:DNA-binding transcriptional MerR regulator